MDVSTVMLNLWRPDLGLLRSPKPLDTSKVRAESSMQWKCGLVPLLINNPDGLLMRVALSSTDGLLAGEPATLTRPLC